MSGLRERTAPRGGRYSEVRLRAGVHRAFARQAGVCWEFERFCFGEHIEVKPRYAIIDDLRSNVNLRNMGARPDGDGPSGKTEVPFRTRVNKYGIYGHGGF